MNGSRPSEGRVEVCYGAEYGTVCDDYWDELETKVVCRQLNYTSDGAWDSLLLGTLYSIFQ